VVEKSAIIDGSRIAPGDAVLGLASSGAHSNGYSLIRRILETSGADLSADFHGRRFSDVIMAPTRIYVKPVLELMRQLEVKALAHITGGGLTENVPRVLPDALTAEIERGAWPRAPLFDWLQNQGRVADQEMFRVFNCGIGMVVVLSETDTDRALQALRSAGEQAWRIGRIRARRAGEAQTLIA
jgi:phosphoribosylformylglycinamidine cyclo-ligase